ncbi:class I SAM-dependent methyltransferase [Gottfriedia luciferensis]|uniref:class I SAM-dependent methyltransferase n=1 Tax=Gottfriedia luciferensis TaxID=178774 RepID=UPI000B44D7A4|nr:class I SAM-dependent methyltransferase [Gottfriedia luciferensis]
MSKIIDYYNQFDEWGRLDREPIEFQVNWHFMKKYMPKTGEILDNGAGPGKYSMKLAKEGYQVTLTDLTPKLVDIAKDKAIELNLHNQFKGFYTMDARHLYKLDDGQFDATLMLGPMYHLQDEYDRKKAVQELYRVTKNDGLVFVAFMSRVRHIMNSLSNPENWKPNNSMREIDKFSKTGQFDHRDEGRFTGAYYFEINEIKEFMTANGFDCIELIGSNIGTFLSNENWNYWKEKDEVNEVMNLLIERANDPTVLGLSSHLLFIGKKVSKD